MCFDHQEFLQSAPFGFIFSELIVDGGGKPVDFHILEANVAVEVLTGLKASEIVGRTLKQVMPGIDEGSFDWIEFCGRIALQGGVDTIEQFASPLQRWYRVQVASTGDRFFTLWFTDVSEEQARNQALERQREQFELAIRGSNDGIWDWDLRTNELYLSDRWKEQLGYVPEEIENRFSEFESRLHPDDRERVFYRYERYLKGEESRYDIEFRMRHKDGSWRWIQASGEALRDANGVAYRMAGSHTDVTERRNAEAGLRANDELLSKLAAQIPGVIYQFQAFPDSRPMRMPFASNGLWEVFELDPAEVVEDAAAVLARIHPEDLPSVERSIRRSAECLFQWANEFRVCLPRRGERWMRGVANPERMADGSTVWHGYILDVTEQQLQADELRSQSSLRQLLMELASSYINLDAGSFDAAIKDALAHTGAFFEADRAYVFSYDFEQHTCRNTHEWCAPGIAPVIEELQEVPLSMMETWVETHRSGENVVIEDVSALPENDGVRQVLEPQSVQSLVAVPMRDGSDCVGFVGFDWVSKLHASSEAEQQMLSVLAQMLINIHLRQKNDSRLRFLSAITDHMSDSLVATDAQFRINYVNRQAEALYGYSLEEVRGKSPSIFNAEPDSEAVQQEIYEALARGEVVYRTSWNRRKDGSLFLCEYQVGSLRDEQDRGIAYIGLQRDVTETKRMEEELRRERRRLEDIIEGTNVGTWEWNVQTGETVFNHRWAEIIGYRLDELEPTTIHRWLERTHPEDVERSEAALQRHFRGECDHYECECRMRHRDGHWVWVLDRGRVAQRDAHGNPLLVSGTHQDISSRKREEQELRDAKAKAEQASVAKSEFLANMSHEIRTPLNSVIGFTNLLMDTALNPQQQQFVSNANVSGQTLLAIINDVLDLSKIEAGKLELEQLPTEVQSVVHQTLDVVRQDAEGKGLELKVELPASMPHHFWVDPIRLQQVLMNLLNNAIKFTSEGSVTLRVSFEPIHEGLGRFGFSIVDTGIGISAAGQTKLFQAFSQADSSITRSFGGTGLGLIISTVLVREMGGHIQVESSVGQGSCFSFSIETRVEQRSEGLPPAHDSPLISEESTLKLDRSIRILVVEDVVLNRALLRFMLHKMIPDVTVLESSDGLEALQLLEQQQVDMILMDVQMPRMDGISATREIRVREKGTGCRVPIIAVTAGAIKEEELRCREAGMDGFLTKPVKAPALMQAIRKQLAHSEAPAGEAQPVSDDPMEVPEAEHFDRQALMERIDHDLELLKLLLESGDWEVLLNSLRNAHTQGNAVAVKAIAHRIKGSALNLQLPRLSAIASSVEQAASQDFGSVAEGLKAIEAEWALLAPILARELEALA